MAADRNMEQIVPAPFGTFTVNDTDDVRISFEAFQIDSAAVISFLGVNSDHTNNIASQYVSNAGGTVNPCLITAIPGHDFTRIQLTSGQVKKIKKS